MAKTSEDLLAYLEGLGIAVRTVTHPPLMTVADSQQLRGEIPGGHTKNLFLKDKKDNYFLLTVDEEAVVDLKSVHRIVGAASRLSFGKPEALMDRARAVAAKIASHPPMSVRVEMEVTRGGERMVRMVLTGRETPGG